MSQRGMRLALVALVMVMANALLSGAQWRVDLTKGGTYSLSEQSERAVAGLTAPLTVKVFFSSQLPAPYNGVERYLRDLLEQYAASGSARVNYQFMDMQANLALAQSYGIYPVQLKAIEQDEVKYQRAYMGVALILGDQQESLPALTTTQGLEWKLTSAIMKMRERASALEALHEPVQVQLILSGSIEALGPHINLPELSQMPSQVQSVVDELNKSRYGKLAFSHADPSAEPGFVKIAKDAGVLALRWRGFADRQGRQVTAGEGYAGVLVSHQGRTERIDVIRVMRVPIVGDQYTQTSSEELTDAIAAATDSVLGINKSIGYLASNGAMPLSGDAQGGLADLSMLLEQGYSLVPVDLSKDAPLPQGLSALLIVQPTERFTDSELYKIDQFMMQGRGVALFMDGLRQVQSSEEPRYEPSDTGLERLIEQLGIQIEPSYVLDKDCYKERLPQQQGGGERPVYIAPIIKREGITRAIKVLEPIKGMVMLLASPLRANEAAINAMGLRYTSLLRTGPQSWRMSGEIALDPQRISPPDDAARYSPETVAALVEGQFKSLFPDGLNAPGGGTVETTGAHVSVGKPSRLITVGSWAVLGDNVMDEQGQSPNTQLVLNLIDYAAGCEDMALLRSKQQGFNPLIPLTPQMRASVKYLCMAGLPALAALAGAVGWRIRKHRMARIKTQFAAPTKLP